MPPLEKQPKKTRPPKPRHVAAAARAAAAATEGDRQPRYSSSETAKLVRISGLPAVAALFAAAPERVQRLFFEPGIGSRAAGFCKAMAAARKPYKQVPPDELARIAGTPMHGSVVALAVPKSVTLLDAEAALRLAPDWARDGEHVLVLDGVSNPHNLGAIARTAAFFGLRRIILSDRPGQAMPSDAAHRVARGGLDMIDLYQAADLPAVLRALASCYTVLGAALGDGMPPEAFAGSVRPVALVMGNEEHGLSKPTLAACSAVVTIPGTAAPVSEFAMQSLNVAASSAILVHALLRPKPKGL